MMEEIDWDIRFLEKQLETEKDKEERKRLQREIEKKRRQYRSIVDRFGELGGVKMRMIELKIIALFVATILVWNIGLIILRKDMTLRAEENHPLNVEPIDDKTKTDGYTEWRTFRHDETNLAYSTSRAPDTNNILWSFLTKKSRMYCFGGQGE